VDWYPWGEEALARAKREDKPIFLSVGYSTCYWCHVMEREVFENEEIAAHMNAHFVCIKVDREERPDLDEIYMTATQLMTQHGGWPNSVFLTPDLKPFFAGTYFGPEDQGERPGFPTLCRRIHTAWGTQREAIARFASNMTQSIRSVLGERLSALVPHDLNESLVDLVVHELAASFDPRGGGFGTAPKFPHDFNYSFLLEVQAHRDRRGVQTPGLLPIVTQTLDAMAAGGIHDHVGGGFHRYATDGAWKIPHFEKMLYNQALLAEAYLDAYKATGFERFAQTARGIFRFVAAVFTGPEGQFYSALDAETDAVEGAYYVWTREEIVRVLGEQDGQSLLSEFELAEVPHFPGHKHPEGGALVRRDRGQDVSAVQAAMLARLAAARGARKLPRLDDKAIAAWNGMMIAALARGYEVLGDEAYRAAAVRGASFVLERMRLPDGRLRRTVRVAAGEGALASTPEGFLEDYAYVARGLLALYRVERDRSAGARWLGAAREIVAKADELLRDEKQGGYFFAVAHPDLIARGKDLGDGATPGGNSVMAHNLITLAEATGEHAYRENALHLLGAFSGAVAQSPQGSIHMAHAVHRWVATGAAGRVQLGAGARSQPAERAEDSKARVSVSVRSTSDRVAPGEIVEVLVTLTIDEGWHVNANPASIPDLIPTVVDVRTVDRAAGAVARPFDLVELKYPPAQATSLAALSEAKLALYGGTVTVTARGRMPADDDGDGVVSFRVIVGAQACSDEGVCLPPAQWIESLVVRVR